MLGLATNIYTVWEVAVIFAGICSLAVVVGGVIFALMREDKNRPLIPWGARMRVEREKAMLELYALEVKRIAVDHQRTRVMEAIESSDHDEVERLALPMGSALPVRGQWSE